MPQWSESNEWQEWADKVDTVLAEKNLLLTEEGAAWIYREAYGDDWPLERAIEIACDPKIEYRWIKESGVGSSWRVPRVRK